MGAVTLKFIYPRIEKEVKMEGLLKFLKDDRGATMVEYALMIALIALVCVLAVTAIGTSVSSKFSDPQLTGALK